MWFHLPHGITSATNKANTTVTKHLSQKQHLVVKMVSQHLTQHQKLAITSATTHNLAIWQKIHANNNKKQ